MSTARISVHTPAPWVIHGGRVFAATGHQGCIATFEGCTNAAANATVICAAPDLLAALSRVSEFLEANYSTADMPDILPVVRAALAKAGA